MSCQIVTINKSSHGTALGFAIAHMKKAHKIWKQLQDLLGNNSLTLLRKQN